MFHEVLPVNCEKGKTFCFDVMDMSYKTGCKHKYIIIQNIVSPYKALLFKALQSLSDDSFRVLFISETRTIREWKIDKDNGSSGFTFDVMFDKKLEDVGRVEMLLETLRRLNYYNPELVIIGGYSYLAYWGALAWAKRNKRKAIVINESHYLDRPRSYLKESIKRLFVSNCDAALVDGARHRDYTVSLGLPPERTFIKMGTGPVDVSWYQERVSSIRKQKVEVCKDLGFPTKNFLFVGRFSPEKNIMSLLRTFKILKKHEARDWGLILVGNGPLREEITGFISNSNLNDVFLPGFKQQEELVRYYAVSDVLVLPSISEPWGLVVSEAMASGLPVIVSTKCGCYPDIVHDGINGFSFDPMREDELQELMLRVVRGDFNLEEMGRASLDIIEACSPERAASVIVDAVQFVLKDKVKDTK